ncbi:DUF885 domain-containing protein [Sphingobium yanoikuyae]|jgi:uncharacterized protein (DUF885 family)|uniref:DUF885 domain-containing protein n=1 Tax=Sphingobium yanoikuyae TaxID=13690 RepID=UPI0004E3EE26|nr:DUF885 domain-containing protein [Sphingobium yanoikuyae]KFD26628.1 hypothetical protein IH86_19200 [Sphingobium yanoikuyae]KZC81478.1 hypothetical protein AYR46_06960 [Sphingobium yanoikuyae]MDV3478717.1 DUF885 domain-containing protein [Sphingobium yanoikuyae]
MRKIISLMLAVAAPALAHAQTSHDQLTQVIDDHWKWYLSVHPVEATARGVRDYDDQISDLSLAARDAQIKAEQGFVTRLDAVPEAGLDAADKVNRAVLLWMLRDDIASDRHQAERLMLFTTYYSWHQGFSGMADGLPFYTRADYDSYLKRLALYPKQNGDGMAITRQAIKGGYVLPCSVLGGFAKGISGIVAGAPEGTRFYEPFTRTKPRDISDADWAALQARAVAVIRDVITPEYGKWHDLFVADYLPKCRKSDSASTLPGGAAWYASRVRTHTTTDLTPDQIHQIGLDEVARIGKRMDEISAKAGYPTRAAFIQHLRTDPSYYAKTPEELLRVAARQAKTIDGLLPRYFATLPRLPYGIKPIPAAEAEGTTTAYYGPGAPEAGISGTYWVNTSKLDQRPFWELPALTAHEAVPGHHNQIALQQELPLPPFRKYLAGFTAYVEGWALYTEYLGEEMGLYDTPEKMMGRLSYEMWRACRLVVDTGIHAKGWDKAKAVAFMKANSALSDANIDAEVNRYISWPGQALGYKLGEIKIRELRARAEQQLGPKFDLRRFHDAVLSQGAVPLTVLESQIDGWIAAEKAR